MSEQDRSVCPFCGGKGHHTDGKDTITAARWYYPDCQTLWRDDSAWAYQSDRCRLSLQLAQRATIIFEQADEIERLKTQLADTRSSMSILEHNYRMRQEIKRMEPAAQILRRLEKWVRTNVGHKWIEYISLDSDFDLWECKLGCSSDIGGQDWVGTGECITAALTAALDEAGKGEKHDSKIQGR